MNWLDAASFWERFLLGTAGGAVVWWSASDLGAAAFDALGLRDRSRSAAAAALGFALVGSIVGLLGLFHAVYWWSLVGLIAVQFCVRWGTSRRLPIGLPDVAAFSSLSPIDRLAVIAAVFACATAAVAAALPATWWDPLAYHLPIEGRALAAHAFVADPAMLQTAFVLLAESAALPAFAIGGSAGAAFATLGSGIVLALLCAEWADRIGRGSGRIAAALVACSALFLWLAPSFYVDIPFAMFTVGALSLATLAADDAGRSRFAIAAGALAGAAAATKYSGLIALPVGLAVAVFTSPRETRVRAAVGFAFGALALAIGWYARTAIVAGDPVYPFLSAHGSGDVADFAQRYVTMTRTWCGGGTGALDAVSLPWRLIATPRSFCGDPGYALDLGTIFVIVSLVALRRSWMTIGLCLVLTAFWFATSQQLRFLMPAVCLYAIAAAAGTTIAGARVGTLGRGLLVALCLLGVAVDWIPGRLDASNSIAPAFAYIAGGQSGDAYLTSRLEFYRAVPWLRAHGDPPVAALDDVRDYYFGAGARWLNPYYQPTALDWTVAPNARYGSLAADGYRYLVVNANSAYVDRTPTGVDWDVLRRDVGAHALKPVFADRGVTVYELTGIDEGGRR